MQLLEGWLRDFRHSIRSLAGTPGFTCAAVLTLALGIAASTTVFSVVDAVLLRPLPYPEPSRRVMIWSRWADFDKTWVSNAEVVDYRTRCRTLSAVAAWNSDQGNLTGDGEPLRIGMARVTANIFSALGAVASVGRTFTAQEDQPGHDRVVIISHGLWERRYGADTSVIGRTLHLDGVPLTVVGVMSRGFQLPTDYGQDAAEPTEAWVPMALEPNDRGNHGLYAAAVLAPGATIDAANAELRAVTTANTRAGLYPTAMRFSALAVPFDEEILGVARPALRVLIAAAAFLLLIACANVANLLLVRADRRRREMAVRAALGGGASRLLGQLLTESVVLSALGAMGGVGLAAAATRVVATARLDALPRLASVALDSRALAFAAAVAAGTTVAFGLIPALRTLRASLVDSLRHGARAGTGGRPGGRNLLVVVEVALAVMLVIGAGLMVRTLRSLYDVPLGIDASNVLTVRLSLPDAAYDTPEKTVLFYRKLLEQIRTQPGVLSAGAIRSLPLAAEIGDWGLDVDGYVETPGHNAKGDWQVATDGAAEAIGERLVRGRFFQAADTEDGALVAVVNEEMVRKYWSGRNPIGGRIRMGSNPKRPWLTVVGVVGNVRHNGIVGVVKEKFYVPHAQFHRSVGRAVTGMTLVVKTTGNPLGAVGAVRSAVQRLDPTVPIAAVRPMSDVVAGAIATQRFAGLLLGLFAGVALLLAAIGVYGVLACLVSQRQHEIGVRLAVGARRTDVVWLILSRGLALSLTGAAVGVGAAFGLTRLMAGLLFGVRPVDPLTFATVPLVLAVVALAAGVLPAHRAARVDPVTALRAE